jgi:hypothetical protein
MLGIPCIPNPIPAITILLLGAGVSDFPKTEAGTIEGNPNRPAAAAEKFFKNCRLSMSLNPFSMVQTAFLIFGRELNTDCILIQSCPHFNITHITHRTSHAFEFELLKILEKLLDNGLAPQRFLTFVSVHSSRRLRNCECLERISDRRF